MNNNEDSANEELNEKQIRKARRGFVMSSDLANNLSPSQNSLAASAQVALAFNDFDSTSEPSIHSIDDEVEDDNDVEPLPTSPSKALSTLDDGTNIIFRHPNSNLDNLSLPQNATHVMIGETLTPDLCPTFLRSLINLNFDTLLVLDIPNCGLTSLPLDLSQLIKLEELNVSNNPFSFYTLPSVISTLHLNLRLLKADNCNLTSLPKELSKMASLNTLSLRNNRFPVLPAWLCLLPNLELLLVDDNPICDQWRPIISPILSQTIRDKSSNPSTPKLPQQQNQNLNLPYHQHHSLTQDLDHLTLRSTTPESMRRMKSTPDITNYTPKAPDRLTSLNYSSNLNLNSNNNIINNNNLNNNYVNVQNNEDNSNPLKKNWGIFKKMSMNRLRSASNVALRQTYSSHSNNVTPNLNNINNKNNNVNNPNLNKHTSSNSSTISSNASKRRSFLPLNSTSMINNNNNNSNGLGITTSPNNSPTSNDDNKSDWFNSLDSHDRREEEYSRGFKSVMSYLKDLYDLGVDADEELDYETDPSYLTLPLNRDSAKFSTSTTTTTNSQYLPSIPQSNINSMNRQLTNESSAISRNPSSETSAAWSNNNGALSNRTTLSSINDDKSSNNDNKSNQQTNIPLIESKSDPKKQYHVIREIIETERTYVKGLQELVDIYVVPSVTEIPAAERKRVYLGVEGLLSFHRDSMLPSLENALYAKGDEIVIKVAQSFIRHAAFLKIYNIYINEFDYAQNRAKWWMEKEVNNSSLSPKFSTNSQTNSPSMQSLTVSSGPSGINIALPASKQPANYPILNSKEKKRIRQFCKAARKHPKHTQLNLESYLLLPIQRIPRYRMLLEECLKYTTSKHQVDPLLQALDHIANIAIDMNESKRDAEGRYRLVKWQSRIRGRFPSPLVQPHRRLLLDGGLKLLKVVKKLETPYEIPPPNEGENTVHVNVVSLHHDTAPSRPLIGLLCTDLMVLCKDPSNGSDSECPVDLYAVLRIQNTTHPAIVHGSTIRLVDHRAILYLDCQDVSTALTWAQAINKDMAVW